jgi:hypothetical protein
MKAFDFAVGGVRTEIGHNVAKSQGTVGGTFGLNDTTTQGNE